MISIQNSLSELERCERARAVAIECYLAAVKNSAQYAVELDDEITKPHRKYLEALASELASASPESLGESRATFRALLRDYRDKAAGYLAGLREELASSVRSLQDILNTLCQADGDQDQRLRGALGQLRQVCARPEGSEVREAVLAATNSIEVSLEEMRKQHQLTVSQFQVEIRMLHKRIDVLETAASIDSVTQLFNRAEVESRIRSSPSDDYRIVLMKALGLTVSPVAVELAGAFTRRLRNSLPPEAVIGRWGREEFVAMLQLTKPEAIARGKWIAEHLSGVYACVLGGKTVRATLQISVATMDCVGEQPGRTLDRISEFLGSE